MCTNPIPIWALELGPLTNLSVLKRTLLGRKELHFSKKSLANLVWKTCNAQQFLIVAPVRVFKTLSNLILKYFKILYWQIRIIETLPSISDRFQCKPYWGYVLLIFTGIVIAWLAFVWGCVYCCCEKVENHKPYNHATAKRELANTRKINYIYNMEAQELARAAGYDVTDLGFNISEVSSGYCSTPISRDLTNFDDYPSLQQKSKCAHISVTQCIC